MGLPEVAEFARKFAVMVRVQGPVSLLISSSSHTHVCLCILLRPVFPFEVYLKSTLDFLLSILGFNFIGFLEFSLFLSLFQVF